MAFKAELLKKKLKEEGKGRDEIAAAVGKDKRTVSRWLAGTNAPKSKDLETIARTLNCKPQDFDPFFADKGLGEVSIQAHVSAASHNAYELMRWRYGVTQKQIMELAPVLFSIVAGLGLKVPGQDDEIARLAYENGLSDPRLQGSHLEDQASKLRKCFGIETANPGTETSRNLFVEAIHRLSLEIPECVDAKWFAGAYPEEVPNAAGYIVDIELVEALSAGHPQMEEAISKGRIRLSSVLRQVKEKNKGNSITNEEIAAALRDAYEQGIEDQRKTNLKKLRAWRAFYAERHPELAKEYDDLVVNHCHEEGWFPDNYTDDDRIQRWVNPFEEEVHFNKKTTEKYHRCKVEAEKKLKADKEKFSDAFQGKLISYNAYSFIEDPIYRRLKELREHRSKIKKQFEEAWA